MQRNRRAAAVKASNYKEEERLPDEPREDEVLKGRRKKPPSLIAHVVSASTPKDTDITRWEMLAFLGFLNEFQSAFAATLDPIALFAALTCGPKPDPATAAFIRDLHLFLLRGISRGRAPVTNETWERVLHNRIRERLHEIPEFKQRNPMAEDDEEESSASSSSGSGEAEGAKSDKPDAPRQSRYFLMTTEERVRILYFLCCLQVELSTSIANEVARREVGEGNGAVRLDPTGYLSSLHSVSGLLC